MRLLRRMKEIMFVEVRGGLWTWYSPPSPEMWAFKHWGEPR